MPTPMTRTLSLPRSGRVLTYELERRSVKNINIRVHPDGRVSVSASARLPLREIERCLVERETWLLRAMERVAARAQAHPALSERQDGDSIPYRGGILRLELTACDGRRGSWELDEAAGVLRLELPDPTSPDQRQAGLQAFEKAATQTLVEPYLAHYIPLLEARGVHRPAAVHYKAMKTRYGSCSSVTHSLSFNICLCELPPDFAEYVVVHELCHFLRMDHSPAFWREVEHYLPDWRRRREMAQGAEE